MQTTKQSSEQSTNQAAPWSRVFIEKLS